MEPHLQAAILIVVHLPHPDKQMALAVACAAANLLNVVALCHHWRDCMALVLGRHVQAVIVAVDPGPDARAALSRAGAEVFIAREEHVHVRRRDVDRLAVRMARRGIDSQEIAQILEVDTLAVRQCLRDAGLRPDPT